VTAIRPVRPDDLPALMEVVDGTGLFPSEMLAGMMEPYITSSDESFWLTFDDGRPEAIMFVEPERMTQGTWNQLLVAVQPERQGQGIGAALMAAVERRVAHEFRGHLLLVETSDLPEFDRTRAFYERLGYGEVARIADFYRRGEGKVIYAKRF
jgi:GNAT superfamily N-acetyltransferase